jgi:hypothetical protein
MRKLNGRIYLEKSDITYIRKETVYYLNNPKDKHEILYLLDSDSSKVVISGVRAFENTLSWEFSSESAINLATIEKCYQSLQVYSTQKLDLSEFEKIDVSQRTTYVIKRHENWLKALGIDIFYEKLINYSKNVK